MHKAYPIIDSMTIIYYFYVILLAGVTNSEQLFEYYLYFYLYITLEYFLSYATNK